MIVRTPEERAGIIESGRRLGVILEKLEKMVAPGVTTAELEDEAMRLIEEGGDKPAFKGYTPEGARRPFPASLCVSVNEEVVHGIREAVALRPRRGLIVARSREIRRYVIIV